MRRALAVLVTAVAVGAGFVFAGAGGEPEGYRVDAIFDNTAGLIPGQDVKIAGARVGSVEDIELTRDRRARVEMEIQTGFAPFRSDATCTIRPQSLIGEKFVQCTPGTPRGRPLPDPPTVPLEQTSSPVDLDLVFAALRRPYSERLAILVNELGTGLAGRPRDLSAAIRRANPALRRANELLAVLDEDRRTLARLVDRSDEVLAELAAKDREAVGFIERADDAASAAAGRRDDLETAVERLPGLLAELEPAARDLGALARAGTPVVRDLRAAAPAAHDLVADFDPLADAARPALVELAEMSRVGRRAVRAARSVAARLRPVAELLPPVVGTATDLTRSLRESGGVEGLQTFSFYGATSAARFDQVSHVLPSYNLVSSCQQYATEPQPGCSAHFGGGPGPGPAAPAAAAARGERAPRSRRPARGGRRTAAPSPPAAAPGGPGSPASPALPQQLGPVTQLLDYLLGR